MDGVLVLHAKGLSLNRISSSQLIHRGVELADHFGYSAGGIQRGSYAARGMSIEARACGGEIYGLNDGGVTASLQSIAACGYVKPQARENLAKHMRRCGLMSERDYLISVGDEQGPLVVVDIPSYFSSPSTDLPMLVNAYRQGGYNHGKADTMLAEFRGWNELEDLPCDCRLDKDARFVVHQMQRIENKEIFRRFKAYETFIADQYHPHGPSGGQPLIHEWLDRLAEKNDLSKVANTVYLLHGTDVDNLDSIRRDGLQTRFSLESNGRYGKGLYFTTSSCKAFQYAEPYGCIILCRVVLGEIEVLERDCERRFSPSHGFDSTHAKKGYTEKSPGEVQLHDEYIVYDPAAVYPELVLHVSST